MLRIEKLLKDKNSHFIITPYRTLDIYLPSATIPKDIKTSEDLVEYLLSDDKSECEVINDE